MKKYFLVLLTTSLGLVSNSWAQQTVNIVTTSVPFLRISPDARSGAMGDLGIATTADANAVFYNASKLSFANSNSAVSFNYSPWLSDLGLSNLYLSSLTYFTKVGQNEDQAIFGNLRYFSLGNMQFTDYSGNSLSTYKPREFSIDLGYTRKIGNRFSMGLGLKYINSSLASGDVGNNGIIYKAGNSVAADISLFHNGETENGTGFNWGLALSNLGSKIGYTSDAKTKDYIPANIGIGATYSLMIENNTKLTLGIDINKLLVPAAPIPTGNSSYDSVLLNNYRSNSVMSSWFKSFNDGSSLQSRLQYSLGAEFLYDQKFALRTGYLYQDRSSGRVPYFSAGVGLNFKDLRINLSYLIPSGNGITKNPLSNTIRLGLILEMNSGK